MFRQHSFALIIGMLCICIVTISLNRNPIYLIKSDSNNIQPDTFTEPAERWVSRLIKAIDTPGQGIDRRVREKVKRKIKEEIEVLRASDQIYHVVESTKLRRIGHTSFDQKNRWVTITLPGQTSKLPLVGHELLHAYQFEIGLLSVGDTGVKQAGKLLKDKTDDRRAYKRQRQLGDRVKNEEKELSTLRNGFHSIYNTKYLGKPIADLMKERNFYGLHNIAESTRQAYRAKIYDVWMTFPLTKKQLDSLDRLE